MHIWLVKLEEPFPFEEGFRPYRMQMLADALLARGHTVTRWASDFDHLNLKPRFGKDKVIQFETSYTIKLLHSAVRYTKRVSPARLANNWHLAHRFGSLAQSESVPDIIVCSMPTPALCAAAAKYGKLHGVPVVLDARDLWPDVIGDELSRLVRFLAQPLLGQMRRELSYAAKNATGLVGITAYFRDHLLRYAERDRGPFDNHFPIGFQDTTESLGESDLNAVEAFLPKSFKQIYYFAGRINSTVANAFEPLVIAARKLETVAPDVAFVICGDGDRLDELRGRAQGLDNLILPGFMDQSTLAQVKHRAIGGLLPIERRRDYQISLSNKIFEYMSAGLPIVCYLDGLPAKVISENRCGLLYSNAEELVARVLELRDDAGMRVQMGRASRETYETKFTAEAVYQSYTRHLEAIVASY